MKRIIILGSKDAGSKNNARTISDELIARTQDSEVSTVYYEDLLFTIQTGSQSIVDTKSNKDLKDADLVVAMNWYKSGKQGLYRDVAFTIAKYLEKNDVDFWNKEMVKQRSISKLSAMMELSLLGLSIPKTYFSLDSSKLLGLVGSDPFILKSAITSRGKDNYLCKTKEEANKYLSHDAPNYFIVQEYIENTSDRRVICFGGEPSLVIERRRSSNETHLNNTSMGGNAEIKKVEDLPRKIIEECKQICYNMGREMAGIDLLPFKDSLDEYYYLEVNPIPQLTSGVYVHEKMVALAESIIKKGNL